MVWYMVPGMLYGMVYGMVHDMVDGMGRYMVLYEGYPGMR